MAELMGLPIGAYNIRVYDHNILKSKLIELGAIAGRVEDGRFTASLDQADPSGLTICLVDNEAIDIYFVHLGLFLPQPQRIRVLNLISHVKWLQRVEQIPEPTGDHIAQLKESWDTEERAMNTRAEWPLSQKKEKWPSESTGA